MAQEVMDRTSFLIGLKAQFTSSTRRLDKLWPGKPGEKQLLLIG